MKINDAIQMRILWNLKLIIMSPLNGSGILIIITNPNLSIVKAMCDELIIVN